MTKTIWCDFEQKDAVHNGEVDQNNELLFQCATLGCGHFVKLPKGMTTDEINTWFATYKVDNTGKVTAEDVTATTAVQEDVLAQLASTPVPEPVEATPAPEETPVDPQTT